MNPTPAVLFACALAVAAHAGATESSSAAAPDVADATTAKSDKGPQASPDAKGMVVNAADAVISGGFVLKDEALSQDASTELPKGAKAVFKISVPRDGDYVLHAVVDAPSEEANSFYVNFDRQPEDPLMIWDVVVTSGFEARTVSWRGNGDANNDEFVPKIFKLTAGEHDLIVIAREGGPKLKRIAVQPAKE